MVKILIWIISKCFKKMKTHLLQEINLAMKKEIEFRARKLVCSLPAGYRKYRLNALEELIGAKCGYLYLFEKGNMDEQEIKDKSDKILKPLIESGKKIRHYY